MRNALIPIAFDGQVLRIVGQNSEPWFVLTDLCRALGIRNSRDAASRLDAEDKGVAPADTLGGRQSVTIVSEPGALQIILRSDAAAEAGTPAYRLRRLVTHEVLPSIRKHGQYPPPAIVRPPIVDVDDRVDDHALTMGERFAKERARWEDREGRSLVGVIRFSEARLKGLETGNNALKKADVMHWLIGLGMDVRYIYFGDRMMTSGERKLLQATRSASPSGRQAIFAQAEAASPALLLKSAPSAADEDED